MSRVSVLFVCLGNICRSPTAHGVFEHMVAAQGLEKFIQTDSAGTSDWHIGRAPDARSQAAALKRGYNLSQLRARQVAPVDFDRFDYILAMDNENLRSLATMKPTKYAGHLGLFLPFSEDPKGSSEVPDPYFGGAQGFDQVLDMVEKASQGLIQRLITHLRQKHNG